MTIFAVYEIAGGRLASWCDTPEQLADSAALQAKGYAVTALDISNADAGGLWDTGSLSFLPRPVETDDIGSPLGAGGLLSQDILKVDVAGAADGDLFRYDAATNSLVKQ